MDLNKIKSVLEQYKKFLESGGVIPNEAVDDFREACVPVPPGEAPPYLLRMINYMLSAIEARAVFDESKAGRWLGFIQGSFWMCGLYSINEMLEHNRLTPKEIQVIAPPGDTNELVKAMRGAFDDEGWKEYVCCFCHKHPESEEEFNDWAPLSGDAWMCGGEKCNNELAEALKPRH